MTPFPKDEKQTCPLFLVGDRDPYASVSAAFDGREKEGRAVVAELEAFRRWPDPTGHPVAGGDSKDVSWLRPDGQEMTLEDWRDPERRVLGMYIHDEASSEVDERGRPVLTDPLLLLVNAGRRPCYFRLPELPRPGRWEKMLNTARPGVQTVRLAGLNLAALSLILLTCRTPE